MKYLYYILFVFLMISCDYQGSYTFKVKNGTSNNLEFRFEDELYSYRGHENYKDTVTLSPDEEKIIRIIDAPLNSPAHDCLNEHGMTYFQDIIFDTYVDGVKLEKQLWQPENWTYSSNSKWTATYSMTITDEMIEINNE